MPESGGLLAVEPRRQQRRAVDQREDAEAVSRLQLAQGCDAAGLRAGDRLRRHLRPRVERLDDLGERRQVDALVVDAPGFVEAERAGDVAAPEGRRSPRAYPRACAVARARARPRGAAPRPGQLGRA